MRARAAGVFVVLALGVAVACTAFNDAVVREPGPDGGGTDAPASPDGGGSGCVHATLPETPQGADDGAISFVAVLSQLAFKPKTGAAPIDYGFDLDDRCTCAPDEETCTPADAGTGPRCDGEGGVDNAAGIFVAPEVFFGQPYELEEFANQGIQKGENGLLIEVTGYNGKKDDPSVTVSLYRSLGPRDVDGNTKPAPEFTREELWTRLREDVENEATRPKSVRAFVKDNILVAALKTSYLPFNIDAYIELLEGRVVARIDNTNGRYALRDGVLVGRWTTKNVFKNLIRIRPGGTDGKRICELDGGVALFESFGARRDVCNAADIASASVFDRDRTPCDALSSTVGFEAVEVTAGETVDPSVEDVCAGVEVADCPR